MTSKVLASPPKALLAHHRQLIEKHVQTRPSFDDDALGAFTYEPRLTHQYQPPPPPPVTPRKKRIPRTRSEEELRAQKERKQRGKHFPENPTPCDHLSFLHDNLDFDDLKNRYVGLRRLISDREKMNESVLPPYNASKLGIEHIKAHINELAGEEQVYVTQATFGWGAWGDKARHSCQRKYIRTISTIYVDVDVYSKDIKTESGKFIKNPLRGKSHDEIVAYVKKRVEEHGVPAPLIISSGRGIYLVWALGARLQLSRKNHFERWQVVQSKLLNLFLHCGADPKVRDLTRILRLVGTRNEKNGKLVSVIYDDGKFHSLEKLEAVTSDLPLPAGWAPVSRTVSERRNRSGVATSPEKTPAPSKNDLPSPRVANDRELLAAQGRAFGKTPSKPLKSSLKPIENNWTAKKADIDTFNQFVDGLRAAFAKKKEKSEHSSSWRYFRFFLDLAHVVNQREGVKEGYRNDFIFWSLALLYNARLLKIEDIPFFCGVLRTVCQDHFNDFDKGGLTSLLERMEEDALTHKANGGAEGSSHFIQQGAFTVKPSPSTHSKNKPSHARQWMSAEHGKNSFRGYGRQTYTPSVRFLIEHFGITPNEQRYLVTLIDEVEKQRRRSLDNAAHQLTARNTALTQAVESGMRVDAAARLFNVSKSTAYRAISQVKTAREQGEDLHAEPDTQYEWNAGHFYRERPTRYRKEPSVSTPPRADLARGDAGKVNRLSLARPLPKSASKKAYDALFSPHSHILSPSKEALCNERQIHSTREASSCDSYRSYVEYVNKKSRIWHVTPTPSFQTLCSGVLSRSSSPLTPLAVPEAVKRQYAPKSQTTPPSGLSHRLAAYRSLTSKECSAPRSKLSPVTPPSLLRLSSPRPKLPLLSNAPPPLPLPIPSNKRVAPTPDGRSLSGHLASLMNEVRYTRRKVKRIELDRLTRLRLTSMQRKTKQAIRIYREALVIYENDGGAMYELITLQRELRSFIQNEITALTPFVAQIENEERANFSDQMKMYTQQINELVDLSSPINKALLSAYNRVSTLTSCSSEVLSHYQSSGISRAFVSLSRDKARLIPLCEDYDLAPTEVKAKALIAVLKQDVDLTQRVLHQQNEFIAHYSSIFLFVK